MALTKKQLHAIQEMIERRMLSFTYEAMGEAPLTRAEVETLKRSGILRSTTKHFVGDSYTIGKVIALVPLEERVGLTFEKVMSLAKRLPPMTDVERKALEYATEKAGTYIRGLKDDMVRRVSIESVRSGESALRRVQDGIKQAIVEREGRSELASNLFNIIDQKTRDWQRVASTEMHNAVQNGIYREIREKSDDGANQLVFKRPNPDACPHCKKVYLKEDGVTPKIFKLHQLYDTNVGLRARDWRPTVDAVHPWCGCQLCVVPEGYDFVEKKMATGPIEVGGIKYRKGEVVPDHIFEKMSADDKDKLSIDAVLSYTGTTGAPIKKSECSDLDDICDCDH